MEILVNDILSTSLVDADMFSLNRQPEDLVALCHEILAGYRISMGSSLNLEILAPTLPVSVDRERISQVILNLLSNARKYSPPNALITVRAMRQNQQAIVSVADQGIGISSEQLDHIFERFYRVPGVAVQTGSSVGVGLGLYIAKSIVENHHGLLSATSTPSQGSIFTFSLPLLLEEKQSSGDGDGKAIQTQANVSLW
jgi:signal transduction histidine kinase